jgi:Raf kinase inhibitor-like YbhB/YbcL family protein
MSILSVVGRLTRALRAGESRLLYHKPEFAAAPISVELTSPAFRDGDAIPLRYTVSAADISPPLAWTNLPSGTKDLALIVEDYDISLPTPMVHLIAYHLDISSAAIGEALLPNREDPGAPGGIALGTNGLGFPRYDGPAPPPGHGTHHYVFQLYALSRRIEIAPNPSRDLLAFAMRDRALALGVLTGTFERK